MEHRIMKVQGVLVDHGHVMLPAFDRGVGFALDVRRFLADVILGLDWHDLANEAHQPEVGVLSSWASLRQPHSSL